LKLWLARAGAVAVGFIVTAITSTSADAVMDAAGIFPSPPRLMSDPLSRWQQRIAHFSPSPVVT
jgi:hypothetical protein